MQTLNLTIMKRLQFMQTADGHVWVQRSTLFSHFVITWDVTTISSISSAVIIFSLSTWCRRPTIYWPRVRCWTLVRGKIENHSGQKQQAWKWKLSLINQCGKALHNTANTCHLLSLHCIWIHARPMLNTHLLGQPFWNYQALNKTVLRLPCGCHRRGAHEYLPKYPLHTASLLTKRIYKQATQKIMFCLNWDQLSRVVPRPKWTPYV